MSLVKIESGIYKVQIPATKHTLKVLVKEGNTIPGNWKILERLGDNDYV